MGNTCMGKAESDKRKFESKLADAIKNKAASSPGKIKSFNQLLLKFPSLRQGFLKCKSVFGEVDQNKDGMIQIDEFIGQMSKLGVQEEDSGVLMDIFNAADIDGSNEIDKKEFIILLAIFHLLKGGEECGMDDDVKNTFQIAEDTFCFFDSSRDGYIERSEVGSVVNKSGGGEDSHLGGTIQKRFAELDWDKNGTISYTEFLFGLENWVFDTRGSDSSEIEEAELS